MEEAQNHKAEKEVVTTPNEVQTSTSDTVDGREKFSFGYSPTDIDNNYRSSNSVTITNTDTSGQALSSFFNQGGADTIMFGIAFLAISILVAFGVASRLRKGKAAKENTASAKSSKVTQKVVVKK